MTQQECTVYKCGFCRKHYLVKHACQKHEKYCYKNPNNDHACFSCPNLQQRTEDFDENDKYGNFKIKTFTCLILDKEMHSYVAERIGHSCLGDTERMPLECAYHPVSIEAAEKVAAVLLDKPIVSFELPF